MQGSNKLNAGSSCNDKLPRVNWPHHASAIQSSSSKDDFLSSSFLFSLPTQRPNPEANCNSMISLRSAACKIQGPERLQVPWIEKAWRSVCNTQVACKSYLRPGLSAKVEDCAKDYTHTYATNSSYNTNRQDNVPRNMIPSQEGIHQRTESGILENNSSHGPTGINSCTRTYQSNHVVRADNIGTTNHCGFARTDAKSCQNVPVADNMCADDTLDAMDDDEIMASIDVDRIVMEHYEATNTHRGLASWQMSTPSGNKCNLTGLDENSLPQELSEICIHGCKLAFCPEAKYHVQEMKDQMLAICSELIDGSGELSPQDSEALRKQRAHLKKQTKLLEDYMARSTQDDERQRSHSMATASQGHHPPMTPSTSVMDNDRFQSQIYSRNEPVNSGSCYPPAPHPYMDSLNTPLTSVQRDYTRTNIDINYTEGSGDKKWSSKDFPWTKELEAHNKRVFGNHSFRPNQREIINATMYGSDVFVLMPTGGGKSLTYQLPALIDEGITLVVCPLVSLIQDQIMHLAQANIPAICLSANVEWTEQQRILRDLMSPTSTCTYKLLYVTPEKIAKSDALLRQLEILYSRGHLSRIVIDEAHCVSQWGHDFRPDYQHLGLLKQKFPETPVLALTATATASVKEDVVQALGLANCVVFRQSFNRPNLRYIVMPKTKKCLEDIDNFIRASHHKECGIIYCLSRMDCEKVAAKLREYGHKASHYHGSMDPLDRTEIQRQWSRDKINIICATVAFGMGINKPDVRFVIHHSLPKSIEGYHQECGRAGRDGQRSSCVLYYNYSDYIRVKHMITQGVVEQETSMPRGGSLSSHRQALETHKENLLCMVSYCENDVDCRRLLQLIHFGETFDPSCCAKTCDNCMKEMRWIEKDVTTIARQLVELVMMTRPACSTSHILEVFRGSVNQNVKKNRHDTLSLHGGGKNLAKGEASRVLRHLVTEGILIEDVKKSDTYGSVSSVLKVNQMKVGGLRSGNHTIVLKFPTREAPLMGKLDESSTPQINKTAQRQSEVDENISSLLFETLKCLRSQIAESTAGCGVHHIFKNETLKEISSRVPRTKEELLEINGIGKVKLNKYGDSVLATIEDFLSHFPNASKRSSSSGSNEQNEAPKKRRGLSATNASGKCDGFEERTVQSKKCAAKTKNTKQGISDAASMVQDVRYIDLDLDGCEDVDDELCSSAQQPVASSRVLPKWPTAVTKVLTSRRSVGVADAGSDDSLDGISALPDTMNLAHKQKVRGVWETPVDNLESTSQSFVMSCKDDSFSISGSSKLHKSTSEETAMSGKSAPSESRKDRFGNNGTSKVPRMGSVLGTAGMLGYGRAVDILDTLGCMMTTLSPDGGFISRATKGCQISILAFEVANTILKGASVMQSLSKDSVTYFKQVVLPSEGVQNLISSDMSELMQIVANDKREELKLFSQEIIRFGNRCKDPQWHNLDRYFLKLESESVPQKQLKETATVEMQKLMALVQRTTELYHELHALDRFEQDYRCQLKGKENSNGFEKGENIQVLRLELKTQRNYVKSLKKRSLWSKTLEDVVEKLVDIVQYLHVEIDVSFGISDGGELSSESTVGGQRLGPAGLALHYANTVIQIYSIVSRSGYVPANSRDALYQGLPPRVRLALPNKLRTSSMPQELTIDQTRTMMEKTLKWLVPMAINTTCARGFLRFSEWAKSGTERVGRGPGRPDMIETLYHADKAMTEAYILELVVWLHHLVNQSNRPPNVKEQSI